jgi:hypothetical protein
MTELRAMLEDEDLHCLHPLRYHIWLVPRLKLLYASVPKNACTTVKAALYSMMRGFETSTPHMCGISPWMLCAEDGVEALTSPAWFRFAVVRNPYDRLFSAFKNQIMSTADPARCTDRDAIVSVNHLGSSNEISFAEFAGHAISTPDEERDSHWQSQCALVMHDQIQYDVIAQLENLAEDMAPVFEQIGRTELAERISGIHFNQTLQIPLVAVYNKHLADCVYEAYQRDFETFGYDKNSWRTMR